METSSAVFASPRRPLLRLAPIAASILLLAACGGSSNNNDDENAESEDPPVVDDAPGTTGTFDRFDQPLIDRSKWNSLDSVRDVGSLTLTVRKFFGDSSATASTLFFAQSGINSIAANVTLDEAVVEDTTSNDARVRARIQGTWYHTAGVAPDQSVGDVFADIRVQQGASGEPEIRYFIGQCQDQLCFSTDNGVFASLGTATIGQAHALSIEWTGSEFEFGVDGTITAVTPPYAPDGAPVAEFKMLRSQADRLDAADEGALIRSTFDDVTVNGAAYDDFSSGQFDAAKWGLFDDKGKLVTAHRFTRVVDNGVLRSRLGAPNGETRSNQVTAILGGAPTSASADVTVIASERAGDSTPRARVAGFWYHSGAASSGNNGDVFAETSLTDSGAGIVARAQAVLCTDDSCSTFTQLFDDTTSLGSVALGETKRLTVSWDGAQFTFKADDRSVNFVPDEAPASGPAQQPSAFLGTRIVGGGDGSSAFIDATIDNVDITNE